MGWIVSLLLGVIAGVWIRRERQQHTQARQQLEAKLLQAQSEHEARERELSAEHTRQLERLRRQEELTRERGHLGLAKELLPGMDALISAAQIAAEHAPDSELERGLKMVRQEFERALARHGVTPIAPSAGQPFDPEVHEAVATAPADAQTPADSIAQPLRTGWTHATMVLRPAMVQVAVASAPSHEPQQVMLDHGEDEDESAGASTGQAVEVVLGDDASASEVALAAAADAEVTAAASSSASSSS